MFRKILLSSCFAAAIAWLAWSIFAHNSFTSGLKPHMVPLSRPIAAGYVRDTSDTTFGRDALLAQQPVFVDFYATWCGPCQSMAPVIDELSTQYKGKVLFLRVDVDQNPQLAARYQISAIPAFRIFHNGKIHDSTNGVAEPADLHVKIDRVLNMAGNIGGAKTQ